MSPGQITYVSKLFFFSEILYVLGLPLVKVSLLFFYLRIFPSKTVRNTAYVLMALSVAYGIAFACLITFQCNPVYGAWTHWDGTFQGHCYSLNPLTWTAAILNLVLDVAVLILPLPEVWKLAMSMTKRVQLLLMFSIGLL